MTDYQKGMASIPSLILIIGALALLFILFAFLLTLFNGSKTQGPGKVFGDDEIKWLYASNRIPLASTILEAYSAHRIFWFGGYGLYLTRNNRGGWKRKTDEQIQASGELQKAIRDVYQLHLKEVYDQEIY